MENDTAKTLTEVKAMNPNTNDSGQEIVSPSTKMVIAMVSKHFRYLVDQHNLTYDGRFEFTSPKVRIKLEIGHKSPRISIYRPGEPEFTNLLFERIVQYFEDRLEIDDLVRYFPDFPLEDNIHFMAKLFKRYADRIINQIDEWWIPVQVFQYKLLEQRYKDAGQLEDFLSGFKRDHDYLKGKGVFE
ncbi:MAG: hypothetical protein Q8L64_02720 [bacterium]|nr:hypothetical protein [bacterium]